ncbi:hypothetical protein BGP78_04385 [Pseudoalteromonas sp. MSK9-3]|uniref:restriction endonuclease subunit S n=1 Tax=Pseudoalteromonas sp. MSK9-3 TaxID=1897633 RepID=UPI000E6BFB14|nr:restriction endonuclease subunit S [Pseudoalteromonas sp. MSK9-3]RJE70818.1 hypothetical protein BGP78_04385 [Pseudoalteromonas sp. MSK9-3]
MANSWNTKRIDEIAQVVDSRHKTPQYSDDGYPMVRVVDVKGGVLQLKDTKRVSDEVYADFSKGRDPEIGDLIISRVGSYGNVAYVNSSEKFCLGQNTALIIPEDKSRYLYYALTSPQIKAQIDEMVVGAVQKTISLKTIKSLQIPEPPSEVKTKISKVLSTIDDKIELNRQTNQTLEQMAQALFKSWFVDFDPVFDNALASGMAVNDFPEALQKKAEQRQQVQQQIANGELDAKPLPEDIQQLFPSEFEQTHVPSIGISGWVPKGWETSNLKSFGKVVTGKTPPKKIENAFADKGLPFITPSDVDSDVFALTIARHLSSEGVTSVKNNVIDQGSVCVTCIGSQMGKTVIAPYKSVTNQQLNSIVLAKQSYRNYVFMNLRLRREELFNLGSSGSTMPILNKSSFEGLNTLKPTELVLNEFSKVTEKLIDKILLGSHQNEELSKVRDTLLPKLISGELTLPADNSKCTAATEAYPS